MSMDENKAVNKPKRSLEAMLKDFFIPEKASDLVFIAIAVIIAVYALIYDIPEAMVPVKCYSYWLKNKCPCALDPEKYFNSEHNITTDIINLTLNKSNSSVYK